MKRSELRALIKEELKKSLHEAEGDFGGTQVSRGKIKKLPTGRFKAKNKEGDSALFSTEKEALQYATASSEEAWNAKFGPQSKKKNVKELGLPRSPKEKTGMDYYDDSHKGSNPNRNRYDRGDDDDYDRRRDADSEDGFDDKYHRIGEVTASDYYTPPKKRKPKPKTEVTASDYYTPPKKKKPKTEASVSTKSIAQILKKGQTLRTNVGYWAAKNMKGDVRYFETEKEAQKFANHAANEAKQPWEPDYDPHQPIGWDDYEPGGPRPPNVKKEAKKPSTPGEHQTAIAKKTLKMPDAMANVMGGPNKKQATDFLKKKNS